MIPFRSLQSDIKQTRLEEMKGQMEAAYGEVDRLRRLLAICQQQQHLWVDESARGTHKSRQNTAELQTESLQKALRILYAQKTAVEGSNHELKRQAEACMQFRLCSLCYAHLSGLQLDGCKSCLESRRG